MFTAMIWRCIKSMINLDQMISSLTARDKSALTALYAYRCLTFQQLYEFGYVTEKNGKVSEQTAKKRLRYMIDSGLIRKKKFGNLDVFMISNNGIEILKQCHQIPNEIFDSTTRTIKRGYYTSKELEIYSKYMNHQLNLNQFVLEFSKENTDKEWYYYDEKYLSKYSSIRPDGMISVQDFDIFLEMDMSTESKKQLSEKWENYRRFLASSEFQNSHKKIVMFFIIENNTVSKDNRNYATRYMNKIENRKKLVRYTMFADLIDAIGADFEVFIGTRSDLLNAFREKLYPKAVNTYEYGNMLKNILLNKFRFSISNGSALKECFNGTEFDLYIRKIQTDGRIYIEGGKVQEYIVDDSLYNPVSILNKITYMKRNNSFCRFKLNREMSYIVVVESMDNLYEELKSLDLLGERNVYYTTIERLETMQFCESIVQFDTLGNMSHFVENGLNKRVFERNVEKQL